MSTPFPREHREDRGPGSDYHAAIQAWHDREEAQRVERRRLNPPQRRAGLGIVLWLIVIVVVTAFTVRCTPAPGDESSIAGLSVAQAVYTPRPLTHWEAYQSVRGK